MRDLVRFKPKLMRDRGQLGAEALVNQQRIAHTGAPEHFPEKWTPVFRRKCDH